MTSVDIERAVCEDCDQPMDDGGSCTVITDIIAGGAYPRIPWGQEPLVVGESSPTTICGDCGVRLGGYHHAGCDMAVCPRCGTQELSDFDCQKLDAGWVAPITAA